MDQKFSEVKAFIEKNDIKYIDFKMTDIRGRWKHLTIPAHRFTENIMTDGVGFDGSNYGYASVKKSDMVFIPDLASAHLDPFLSEKTLSMIGDVMVIDKVNYPFAQYPRNVARRALAFMKETGIADEMIIGPEYEFHVFDRIENEVSPLQMKYAISAAENSFTQSNGFNNAPADGYHSALPNDPTFDLRNEICSNLADFGVDVKYHHHEVGGSGQLEIETSLGEMLKLADDTMAVKYIVRNTATSHGKTACFLPKPIYGEAGNGMHVHMILRKDGKPVFYDENGYCQLSQTAMYFIGGLLKHVKAICAFANPSTNSYRRLVPGFEAPVTIGYASANRSSVIRIPSYAKDSSVKRFELRSPDATCNPYYTYAAILMAGLDGVINRIDPADHNWGPFDINLFELSDEEKKKLDHLPTSLTQAIAELEKDHDFLTRGGVFSEELLKNWTNMLKKDVAALERIPNPAEISLYYNI